MFASAFVFLFLFIGLTLSDELFRPSYAAAKVVPVEAPAGQQAPQMDKLRVATPELVEQGKQVYANNCVTCHGPEGKGDGPAAAAFNPKPRDFTAGVWTEGGTPAQVFHTVSNGIPGTSMPGFGSLSVVDRWRVVHYIRSLSPNTPEDTPETLKSAGIGNDEIMGASSARPRLPIDFAIDRLVEEAK